MNRSHARPAFTLVELLVVVAIGAVLLALTLSAVQNVRAAAARVACMNNLKQIGLALHQYHDSAGALPPGCSYRDGKDPYPHMSWMTRLLPNLDQDALWRQAVHAFGQDKFFETPPHRPTLGTSLKIFTCPADARAAGPGAVADFKVGFTSYLGVSGSDLTQTEGLLYLDSAVRFAEITDGTANTVAVGERPPTSDNLYGWWYAGWGQVKDGSIDLVLGVREIRVLPKYGHCRYGPYRFAPPKSPDDVCDAFHFWSRHPGGGHFLFADGSVRFLTYAADAMLPALATRAGGEAVSP